jgi:glycine/D-amino acid oxidase-like deaminating enzyme
MSRFATVKSEDARLDALSDPSGFGDLDENDPQSVARFVKKMGREMGEDLGEDLDAAMDEAMAEGDGPDDDDGALMDPDGGGADAGEQLA